ncbi:hypothetical protein Tco_0225898 [Tanacetum coccineum]
MNSEGGSGGSSDDGNGNDMGTCGGKCSDDGGGVGLSTISGGKGNGGDDIGSGGEEIWGSEDDQGDSVDGGGDGGVGVVAYSAMRASMDGDIGGSSLTVLRALWRRI